MSIQQPLLSGDGETNATAYTVNPVPQEMGRSRVDCTLEDTPAYEALRKANLLTSKYRVSSIQELVLRHPNTSKSDNFKRFASNVCWPPLGCLYYDLCNLEFTVPAGHVQKMRDNKGGYELAGPGMHYVRSMFVKLEGPPVPLRGHVKHGDISIVVVDQGRVGITMDNGSPILLPPGMHQWKSDTLDFQGSIDLEEHVIKLGPYTLLTVDEGYAAVTQNNGQQIILGGGQSYLLTHRNWKFEKFMSLKIQTDKLESITATSADNIIMKVTSTVVWRITDVRMAATMAAETMATSGRTADVQADIRNLRHDVLEQAIASLASFIGSVNYSDSFHLAAAAQASAASTIGLPASGDTVAVPAGSGDNPMFDIGRMKNAVEHANDITMKYGVMVLSINIISANPVDGNLSKALASGAVASAEALQMETAARGRAKAQMIDVDALSMAKKVEADADAQARITMARANATAAKLEAEGKKEAADLLSTSDVAVKLATLDAQKGIYGQNSKYFFGETAAMPSMVLRDTI